KTHSGSRGYVEYQYGGESNITQAAVLNAAGKFVKASAETTAAACHAAEAPLWNSFSASLVNAPGAVSYPLTSFTWLYLRTKSHDSDRAAALNDFLNWF